MVSSRESSYQNTPTNASQGYPFQPVISQQTLHRRPEVVRIEELRELPVHVDNVNVALVSISNYGFRVLSLLIPVHINSQASVDLKLQTDFIVHQSPPRVVSPINALQF